MADVSRQRSDVRRPGSSDAVRIRHEKSSWLGRDFFRTLLPPKQEIKNTKPKHPERKIEGDARYEREPGIVDGQVVDGRPRQLFRRQGAEGFDHTYFHV